MIKKLLQKLKKDNGGFSLIEVLVAIVILGVIVVPVCQGIVNSVAINRAANEILQARLAVSSAVETLMADGVQYTVEGDPAECTLDGYEKTLDENGELAWRQSGNQNGTAYIITVTPIKADHTPAAYEDVPLYYQVSVAEVPSDEARSGNPVKADTKIRAVDVTPEDETPEP